MGVYGNNGILKGFPLFRQRLLQQFSSNNYLIKCVTYHFFKKLEKVHIVYICSCLKHIILYGYQITCSMLSCLLVCLLICSFLF